MRGCDGVVQAFYPLLVKIIRTVGEQYYIDCACTTKIKTKMVGSSTNQFYSQKSKQSRSKVHVETCQNLSNFLANRSDADVKKDLK